MQLKLLGKVLLAVTICTPMLAQAELGVYTKAGTLGFGGGLGYGVSDSLTARLGYTTYSFDHDIDTTDVTYKGKIKLGGGEAMLDWFPFSGTFRVTGGLVFSRNKIDVDGVLNQSVTINGQAYQASDLGTLSGTVKFKSTVPYLGVGWGNVAGKDGNFHFVADIGVTFQGSPKVKLNGGCSATTALTPTQCNQLQSNIQAEEDDLNHEVSDLKMWPVLNLGLAYRF